MCRYNETQKVHRKVQNYDLIVKAVTIINPITGWFKITQYGYRKIITIVKLLQTTWLTRYFWPTRIAYNQGS